jgi:hypothetical protein
LTERSIYRSYRSRQNSLRSAAGRRFHSVVPVNLGKIGRECSFRREPGWALWPV